MKCRWGCFSQCHRWQRVCDAWLVQSQTDSYLPRHCITTHSPQTNYTAWRQWQMSVRNLSTTVISQQ